MLTAQGCLSRRQRLLKALDRPADLVLTSDPRQIFYLSNLWISPNSLNAYGPAWLLIHPGGETTLLIDNFTAAQAEQAHVDRVETTKWYTQKVAGGNRAAQLNAFLIERLRKNDWATEQIACAFETMPHEVIDAFAGESRMRPAANITPILDGMRRAKDPDEIETIRDAMKVGEAIHAAAWDIVKPGASEHEVYTGLHRAALEAAAEPIVMRCDVTATPRPHPPNGTLKLAEGMLVILDMFPLLNGYRCDITNTICVGGKPSKRQQFLFDLCRQAMAAGEQALRIGAKARDVYAAINRTFIEADEHRLFPHHAGHAIGLDHPEAPYFIPGDTERLAQNNVFTLEPGLYDPQHGGIRIENNYLLTEAGLVQLSHHRIALAP